MSKFADVAIVAFDTSERTVLFQFVSHSRQQATVLRSEHRLSNVVYVPLSRIKSDPMAKKRTLDEYTKWLIDSAKRDINMSESRISCDFLATGFRDLPKVLKVTLKHSTPVEAEIVRDWIAFLL